MKNRNKTDNKEKPEEILPGYLPYPEQDDIYNKFQKAKDADPENPQEKKVIDEKQGHFNEKDFDEDHSGDDLDVPGAELDDQEEDTGSEDEENNYYSLGDN